MESNELFEAQVRLEQLYSKFEQKRYIKDILKDQVQNIEDETYRKFVLDLMVNLLMLRRAKINVLVGILRHHYEDINVLVSMIEQAAKDDYIDYYESSDDFVTKLVPNDEMQTNMDRYQYPLPMVTEPQTIKSNRDTGYYDLHTSCLLKDSYHKEDVCLDHLNRTNKIKFAFNWDTAKAIELEWKNLKKREGESEEEYTTKLKQLEKFKKDSWFVMITLDHLNDYFYLCHGYDKRGRCYPRGYHCNYQGADWNKGVIEFYNQEVCR